MATLLLCLALLVATHTCSCSLLYSDGVLVQREDAAREIVSTWTVVLSLRSPAPNRAIHYLKFVEETLDILRGTLENDTYTDYKMRLNQMTALMPPSYNPTAHTTTDQVNMEDELMLNLLLNALEQKQARTKGLVHDDDNLVSFCNLTGLTLHVKPWNDAIDMADRVSSLDTAVRMLTGTIAIIRKVNGRVIERELKRAVNETVNFDITWNGVQKRFLTLWQRLEGGLLTHDILQPDIVNTILQKQMRLHQTEAASSNWYYRRGNVKVEPLGTKGRDHFYRVLIPTFSKEEIIMYSITTIPVHTGHKQVWREIPNLPTCVGWSTTRGLTVDCKQCYGHAPAVCPTSVLSKMNHCLTGMLSGRRDYLRYCPVKLFQTDIRERAKKLSGNNLLVSGQGNWNFNMHCHGSEKTSKVLVDRIKLYHLSPGCIFESRSFLFKSQNVFGISSSAMEADVARTVDLEFKLSEIRDMDMVEKVLVVRSVLIVNGVSDIYTRDDNQCSGKDNGQCVASTKLSGISVALSVSLFLCVAGTYVYLYKNKARTSTVAGAHAADDSSVTHGRAHGSEGRAPRQQHSMEMVTMAVRSLPPTPPVSPFSDVPSSQSPLLAQAPELQHPSFPVLYTSLHDTYSSSGSASRLLPASPPFAFASSCMPTTSTLQSTTSDIDQAYLNVLEENAVQHEAKTNGSDAGSGYLMPTQ